MRDFLFVSFFLGHDAGDRARRLLADCELLDVALSSRANRHAWMGDLHFGVYLRLPVEDERLKILLERLRAAGESHSHDWIGNTAWKNWTRPTG